MPVNKHRKKIYDGTFFNQGLLAPAKMQMAFGNWDKAAQQFELIVDKDTVYSYTNMEYKNGLTFFVKGMDALVKNNIAEAEKYSISLDALLWRNAKQTGKDSTLNEWYQNTINTASLELQGCIASYRGDYNLAIKLLEKAQKQEIDLGYGEPPLYARPVAVSIADAQIKAEKYDKAIDTYQALLKRFPKSAFVYNCLRNVYLKKGKTDKVKEYEMLLKDASMNADYGMYGNF